MALLFCFCLSMEMRAGSTWPQDVILVRGGACLAGLCVLRSRPLCEQERDQDLSQEILELIIAV